MGEWPGSNPQQIRVPHLRDSLIVANRGPRQLAGGVSFGGVREPVSLSCAEF